MEYDAFLSAIIENSTDDAPRLIYADWLEEHGQSERAEFIRVQCALAAIEPKRCPNMETYGQLYGYPIVVMGTECRKCQWCLLTKREQALYRHQPGELQCGRFAVKVFRRGFIAEVTLACQDWLTHGPQLVKMTPLEKVTLSDKHASVLSENVLAGEPFADGSTARMRWRFACFPGDYYAMAHNGHDLPVELFQCLPPESFDGGNTCFFETSDAAQAALSSACLAWAKMPVSAKAARKMLRPRIRFDRCQF